MKNYIKWGILLLIVICIVFIVIRKNNISDISTAGEIKIGAVMALTGPSASQGVAILNGLKWKIDELNQAGANYKLLSEDSKTDAKEGVSAFSKLVNVDNVKVIFSHLSSVALSVKPLAEQNKVLEWAYSANPDVIKDSSYVLRHAYDSNFDAKALTDHIANRSLKRVYVVYQQEPYGQSFNDYLTKYLQEKGITVGSAGVDNKSADFRAELTKAKSFKPDAIIFVIIGNGSGLVIKQVREIGYTGDIYSSAGFIISPGALDIAGTAAKGMYYQVDQYDPTQNAEFASQYEKLYGQKPQINVGLGYIDMEIIDQAIKNVGSNDPLKLVNYIKTLTSFKGKYQEVVISKDGSIVIPTVIKTW